MGSVHATVPARGVLYLLAQVAVPSAPSSDVMATLTDPDVLGAILEHHKLALKPPPRAAARRPAWDQLDLAFDEA